MRVLAGLTAALLLSACVYVPPTGSTSASATGGYVVEQPIWQPVSIETGKIADIEGFQSLRRSFPDSSSVHLRLLQAHFAEKNAAAVVREALWLAKRGYVFSDAAQGQILDLAGDTAIAAQMARLFGVNAQPVTNSTVYGTVPAKARLVESMIIDPTSRRPVVSSIIERDLFANNREGWEARGLKDVGSLTGMVIDQDGNTLWISSGVYDPTPNPETAFRGLIGYNLTSRMVVHRLAAPEGATLSDLHMSPEGDLFASDPINGVIYRAHRSDGRISVPVPAGTFRSPQGLATSADGSKLYVSDYRYGIAIVDLTTGSVSRLTASFPMALDGIDGMWRDGNRLIGIQNGMRPMRIVAITLAENGMSATKIDVLEQAHPEWTEPLGGTIHDGALYYVATGQWDRFGDGGTSVDGKPAIATQLRRLPL